MPQKSIKGLKTALRATWRVVSEPGTAMALSHVFLAAAVGGPVLTLALASLSSTVALNILKETGLIDQISSKRVRDFLNNENLSMRIAGAGLIGLSGLAYAKGMGLLALGFAACAAGNLTFNTRLSRKLPVDNVLYTVGSCTTAFIAGGSYLPWLALVPGSILASYNVMKKSGNRNLGRPKLWFAGAQALSAIFGLTSGQPERFLPGLAMLSVTWGYMMMEARTSGWLGEKGQDKKIVLPEVAMPKIIDLVAFPKGVQIRATPWAPPEFSLGHRRQSA